MVGKRRVSLTRGAERDLERIGSPDAVAIIDALNRFAATASGDVKKLHGYSPPSWRLRVGRYRAIYTVESDVIVVRKVSDRRDAYRRDM
jgi:mRNA-degrading endonuclease RelE of RelBE toxin-antitoxin system